MCPPTPFDGYHCAQCTMFKASPLPHGVGRADPWGHLVHRADSSHRRNDDVLRVSGRTPRWGFASPESCAVVR